MLKELPEAVASDLEELLRVSRTWFLSTAARDRSGGPTLSTRELPPELARTVDRTFALLQEEPDAETREAIGLGLLLVAEWAEVQRAYRTAVVFYHAALTAIPDNVQMAYHIGRLLRRIAMYDEAEAWLVHTVDKAAVAENWENHALALSGIGNLKRERGNFPESVRFHRLTLESARQHGVRRIEGDALYDLAVMYFEQGKLEEGMGYAREAIAAYGPGHSQLVRMTNDLAWIWMHLHGQPRLALQMFQEIEPRVQDPPFRAVLLANIARAAAEMGAEPIYELAWLEAFAYMRKQDTDEGHAAAFAQLALASVAALQLERARQSATMCLTIAERRRERRSIHMAEQILSATEHGLPNSEQLRELFPAFTVEEPRINVLRRERDEDFAATISAAVRARRDDAPESPVRTLVRGK
jgi:tetratricopeptide (TPR) repeat protein